MTRLRTALAVLVILGIAPAAHAGDPAVEQGAKALDELARDAGATASMASKAAAEALLSPSNQRKFAKTKRGAGSLGGTAAAVAAGSDPAAEDAEGDEIPLPVRKPRPAYGPGGKTYETAGSNADKSRAPEPPPVKDAQPTKEAKPAESKPPAHAASEPAKADPKKSEADTKAAAADTKKNGEATDWPAADIELAKARCTQLLKGLDAVTVAETPFRKGECGTPAPVRLVSIGKNPEVTLSPPALVTCDMVASLHKWLKGDLQPLARKHLGADIVRIETMSDYSCRRAYGRVANRLSEHGRANALDIRGFITSNAKTAYVLEEWGPTRRDVLRKLAAAKAEAEKADAARLEAEKKAQDNLRDPKTASAGDKSNTPPAAVPMASGAPAAGIARTTIIDGLSKLTVTLPGGKAGGDVQSADAQPAGNAPAIGIAPRHLGGPKDKKTGADKTAGDEKPSAQSDAKPAKDAKPGETAALGNPITTGSVDPPLPRTAMSRFLHEAHVAACRIFGTTLGPEANEAHRNHFHVDMAERKLTKICE